MAVSPSREIDLLDGAFYGGDPHPAYTWMRENAPVYYDAAHNAFAAGQRYIPLCNAPGSVRSALTTRTRIRSFA